MTLTCDCNNVSMILFDILEIIFCLDLPINNYSYQIWLCLFKNKHKCKTKQNSINGWKETKQVTFECSISATLSKPMLPV